MIFDWHDHQEAGGDETLDRLRELKARRIDFRCTLMAIPGLGTDDFWDSHPDWIELAVHGWKHPDPYECSKWDAFHMDDLIHRKPARFVNGFCAPGWQISPGCFQSLLDYDWWVAVHPDDRRIRPAGLRVHELNVGPDHWHGHVTNCCGNGLEETWDKVVALVDAAPSFEFMSEVAA